MAGMTRDDVFRVIDQAPPLEAKFIMKDLTGANLRHLNLAGAEFHWATFTGADLSRANLSVAELTHSNLANVMMADVDFRDAAICDSDFSGANLRSCSFPGTVVSNSRFDGADLSGAYFPEVILRDVSFAGANLTDAHIELDPRSDKVNFENADLTSAILAGKYCTLNFRGANLTGACMANLETIYSDFTGADLTDAILPKNIDGPKQLLNARGSRVFLYPATWDQLLPDDPHAQNLARELLEDWDGTIGEAIATAKTLRTA